MRKPRSWYACLTIAQKEKSKLLGAVFSSTTDKNHFFFLQKSFLFQNIYLFFVVMKSVVVFIENLFLPDDYAAQISDLVNEEDVLTVVYRLPEVKADAMPLIGDLREIRLKKAKRNIEDWFNKNELTVKSFSPFVYDQKVTPEIIRINLNGDERFLILYEKGKLEGLQKLLKDVLKEREVTYKVLEE